MLKVKANIPKVIKRIAVTVPVPKSIKGWLLKNASGSINKGNPIFMEYQQIFMKLPWDKPAATAQHGATGGVINPIIET